MQLKTTLFVMFL